MIAYLRFLFSLFKDPIPGYKKVMTPNPKATLGWSIGNVKKEEVAALRVTRDVSLFLSAGYSAWISLLALLISIVALFV